MTQNVGPYVVNMTNVAVTGAITLIQIKAGATRMVMLLRASVSQSNMTTMAMQRVQILRKTGTATVTSYTPLLYSPSQPAADAAGGTSATGTNASNEGTDGDILVNDTFNILNGWLWIPTPEERIVVPPGGFIGLKLPTAPGSSMTTTAQMVFYEM
jgi:hypothetical protein